MNSGVYPAQGSLSFLNLRPVSLAKFQKFAAIISFEYFSSSAFILFFQNSNDTNVTSFIIVPQVPEALFIFFQSIFLSVV